MLYTSRLSFLDFVSQTFFLAAIVLIPAEFAGAVVPIHDQRHHAQRFNKYPQRTMLIKLAKDIDRMKPFVNTDIAGIAFAGNVSIGSGDRNWVVARSYSGETLWTFPANHQLTTPPEVIGNYVYLTMQSGEVVKLQTMTGKKVWSTKLGSYASRPLVVVSGIIVVATARQYLYALAEESGKTLWLYDSEGSGGMVIQGGATPIVVDRTVYYGNSDGKISALDLETGQVKKRYSLPKKAGSRFHDLVGQLFVPAQDSLAFASSSGLTGVLDLRSNNSELKWSREFPGITSMVCRATACYIGTVSGEISAINLEKGSVRWHKTFGWIASFITPYKNSLYVSGTTGFITKIHISSGNRIWQEDLGSPISSSPVISRGMIFFTTGMRNSYGYRL